MTRHEDPCIADQLWADYARRRDPRTREALVMQFRRLAFSIANRFARRGIERDDLEQVALVGLVKAVDRFDPGTRHRFTTFAAPTILGELRRHFRDHGWSVHVPRGLQELSGQVERTRRELTERHGRPPSASELASRLELPEGRIREALLLEETRRPLSLDGDLLAGDGEHSLHLDRCLGTVDERLVETERRIGIGQALQRLPQMLRAIVMLRYLRGQSLREVGRSLGLSPVQVARLEKRALARLRAEFSSH